jgi:hypothetical protein
VRTYFEVLLVVFGVVVDGDTGLVVAHPAFAVLAPFVALGDPELRGANNHKGTTSARKLGHRSLSEFITLP